MDHFIYIHGVKFPNRLFVGGLPITTLPKELALLFEQYGTVTEAKIILDKVGVSRGYGFVTMATPWDVKNILKAGEIWFKGKKLNLGPAVRKQAPDCPGETVFLMQPPQQLQ